MPYELTKFLHHDGTDTNDIMPSVVSFECTNGLFPEMGSLRAVLTSPLEDVDGNPVSLAKGDLIWPYFRQDTPSLDITCPMAGYVTEIRQEGDILNVTAESLAAPFLRSTFTGTYTAEPYVYAILTDVVNGYTPPMAHLVFQFFDIYRPSYGASQLAIDAKINDVTFDKAGVAALYQYFSEFPAIASLAGTLSTAFAVYPTDETVSPWKPLLGLYWSGFGNHPISATQLTYDNGLMSQVKWKDDTESILNDVTIKIRDGQTYQKTDAASIAAYGQRATTLYRPMYTDLTYAQSHADTMVAALKDPKVRCSVAVDANVIFPFYSTGLNWVFQIVDDLTGRTEDVTLVKTTIRWPEFVAECEFDNAALNLSRYGLRMENRVTNLEDNMVPTHGGFGDLQGGQPGQYYHLSQAAYNNLYQQDQAVKAGSSPTFTAINIGADCQLSRAGVNLLYTPDSLQLAGGVYAGGNITALGEINVAGRTGHEIGIVNISRGANNYGWNYRLAFNPYTGDGALSDSKPSWFFQAGYSSHELNIQHYNGSTQTTVMQFLVDKSINIVNGLTVGGTLGVTGGLISSGVDCTGIDNFKIASFNVLSYATPNTYLKCGSGGAIHLQVNGASKIIMNASGDLSGVGTLNCGAITATGAVSAASASLSGNLTASRVYFGAGGPSLEGVGSDTIRLATGNKLTQGGFQFLGANRDFYGTSFSIPVQASANYRNTHDAEKFFAWGSTYAKQKTITLTNGMGPGTFRVRYEIRGATSVSTVRGKVYINGADSGGYMIQTGTTWVEGVATITGPLEPGSTVELWCYQNGGDSNGGYCRNFRIGYDVGTAITMPSSNS